MDVKKELIIGTIGVVVILFLSVFYARQFSNINKSATINKPKINMINGIVTELTVSEITKHNIDSDCWIIINNSVYQVTEFLSLHPGGASRITPYCGQDATTAFDTKGGKGSHSSTAIQELDSLKLGVLNEKVDISNANIKQSIDVIKNSPKKERELDDD
ncbi:MAG: cytochrome b5-like heme/steroid binding domain-containing protein [Patescibacteria group bacterium]|jgi:cytochrome b involved in lipid metabolism